MVVDPGILSLSLLLSSLATTSDSDSRQTIAHDDDGGGQVFSIAEDLLTKGW